MAKYIRNAKRANRPNPREDKNIHYLNVNENTPNKKIKILPRNINQEQYIELLEDYDKSIVFATGPAGTGKTLIATLYAIQQLRAKNIKKIIITRPLISADEDVGFLPGSLVDKLAPWCIPILDIFKEYYTPQQVEKMILDETLELAPLGMMRGRTIKNAICILDEAQNATPNQVKMMLTRIGDGTRIFVTGDGDQLDRKNSENGLIDFSKRIPSSKSGCLGLVQFGLSDVERHPAVEEVLKLYGD